jgi:hypothetical protein
MWHGLVLCADDVWYHDSIARVGARKSGHDGLYSIAFRQHNHPGLLQFGGEPLSTLGEVLKCPVVEGVADTSPGSAKNHCDCL